MNRILTSALLLATAQLGACASTSHAPDMARCTTGCNTHEEGYQWAQSANLLDRAPCSGDYPKPFIEGCEDGVDDLYQLRRATRNL